MKVAIVKYNAGNTASVANALQRLGVEPIISDDSETIRQADRVIFPGVGEASTAMNYLRERRLDAVISNLRQPVLGICLGMQLLCKSSEENDTSCLGIIPASVRKFPTGRVKVPHVGWNTFGEFSSALFQGIADSSFVYFVHAYFIETNEHTSATCDYAGLFSAGIEYRNFYAVQFHPEKSGETGARVLQNFLKL